MSPIQSFLSSVRRCCRTRLAKELTGGILLIVIDSQPADGNSVDQQVLQLGACRRSNTGVSDLSTHGSRVCYRKLYGQLVSNAPFPAP